MKLTKGRARQLMSKGEKLRRLAYDLEADAKAIRHGAQYGGDTAHCAEGIGELASRAGSIGRRLCDIAESYAP